MARSPEETYIQTYKKYLKQKDNSDDLRKPHSTASTKLLKPMPKPQECKICTVLAKPQDLYKVLNEGLYHKYTASQDYFYTRDINALLARKRKTFCVRYNDDLIFDECKERLKGYFKKRDALSLMTEIKDFYTKFKNFPRNFHAHFSRIINSNIRKHRRLEYMIVFNNPNFDESRPPAEDPDASNNGQFNFMEMLGNSFLQDNYKDMSGIVVGDLAVSKAYTGESSVREIAANFKALYNIQPNTISDPASEPFSNALYNKNYMLYSRSDSTTAEDILKQIVNEFREGDLVKKPAMTLAEKVMQQVSANPKNPRKQENRYSPTLKQRAGTGETEVSSLLQASKKSLGSSTSNLASSLMQSQKQPNQANQPLTTSQRGASNPRSNSHIETDNASIVGKIGQKLNNKFSVENLNDVVINRNKILSKLYQFRSTRSKSGGLKSVGSAATGSKTPSGMGRRPVGFNFDTQGYDSTDSKQLTTVFYTHEKSHSNSPERRISKDRADKSTEILAKSKLGVDSPYYSALTRSTSFGPNGEFRAAGSPTHPHGNRSSTHKKSNSAARRSLATPKKQSIGPMIQNYILNGHNNSGEGSANNLSHNHYNPTPTPNHQGNHGNPASPVGGKFINLVRPTTSNPQTYYFRHQSPMEEKIQVSGVLQKVKSEARIKNLNMRALKNTSPKRMENYRMATMSMSGRHQTMLDLSHGVNSFAGPQSSMQLANGSSHGSKSRNLRKSDANLLGSKVAKRSSMIQSQAVVSSSEDVDEKRSKKVLELSNGNINTYKDLKLPSKEQTPMNYFPSSATSLQKFRSELKRGTIGSYSLKGSSKDLKLGAKK